ncbi:4-alpha-glucanotransferase [Ectothiorhodospira variabilis]|uniref:4-alpha-glucanotransferase n=1 Tax=Ectothiorhodospira variabilis TaxID=505694 RepID=UPI001EFAC9C6|nr:4-alpha-glucanotransferase [Ectothiorhodospira variabilis]MCG5504624.1 4-alpha-glucanotransferase [Ectothiorhodospira variabilis]MCG5507823.1 4-alpha-glucanotransferase [Ectothiorhodospira variabilis]
MAEHSAQASSTLDRRRAGILLHPTSLPGSGRQGALGSQAHRFVDFLASAGVTVWQVLPLNQPHEGGSPYQCMSVHAGSTQLICLADLKARGWLVDDALPDEQGALDPFNSVTLRKAHEGFMDGANGDDRQAFEDFRAQHAFWLEDYVLYLALKREHDLAPWWDWAPALRDREPEAMAGARERLADSLAQYRFEQFLFYLQWAAVKQHANHRGILLFGDMPIFVAHDSADVWAHRELFDLDDQGRPVHVAGVPPDYFSATGQRWGNPHYDWERMREEGFAWWIERIGAALEMVDLIRIDHFRGFESYWSIPVEDDTAMNGHWTVAPGKALFERLREHFGSLPLVAEDLGVITDQVEALRDDNGLPGMKILHFAFEGGATNPYLPHQHVANSVVYTGTHDNDTTLGWFEACDESLQHHVLDYLGHPSEPMPWPLIRSALASVARLAVVPMQDALALDGSHRMNVPGTTSDNWAWRFQWEDVPQELASDLRRLVELYGRD